MAGYALLQGGLLAVYGPTNKYRYPEPSPLAVELGHSS